MLPERSARDAPRAMLACVALLALTAGPAALLSGCGGGSRADAGEVSRSYQVKVLHASFPSKQAIARPARMELAVENTGSRTVPDLAITVDSFNYISNYPRLAARSRPIWAVEQGPGAVAKPSVQTQEVSTPGGETAYLDTWALGSLAPGATQTYVWKVVPVKAGFHTVHYTVAAGLAGRAKATLASGGPATGAFEVQIAGAPTATHVDPKTGKVVSGAYAEPVSVP